MKTHASDANTSDSLSSISKLRKVFKKCLLRKASWNEYLKAREEFENFQRKEVSQKFSTENLDGIPKGDASPITYDPQNEMFTTPGNSWTENYQKDREIENVDREDVGLSEDAARLKKLLAEGEEKEVGSKARSASRKVREMSPLERAFWKVIKAVIPIVAIMAGMVLLGTLLGPAGLIIAGILLGAATAAAVTYANDPPRSKFSFEGQTQKAEPLDRDSLSAPIIDGIPRGMNSHLPQIGSLISSNVTRAVVRVSFSNIGRITANVELRSPSVITGNLKNSNDESFREKKEIIRRKEKRMKELAKGVENGTASKEEVMEVNRLFKEVGRLKSEY